jgi:hypothetical protein
LYFCSRLFFPQVHGFLRFIIICFSFLFLLLFVLKYALNACLCSTVLTLNVSVLYNRVARSATTAVHPVWCYPVTTALMSGSVGWLTTSHLYRRPCTGTLCSNCLLGASAHAHATQ